MEYHYWIKCIVLPLVFALEALCEELSNEIGSGKGPRVVSLKIRSDVVYRFAETVISSTVVNDDVRSHEAEFDVSLPDAAFISNFTLTIDNVYYPAIVKEKESAKKVYDKAKKKGQTTGHVATKPRGANTFRVSINVAAQSEAKFILTYDELLQRRRGQYEHTIFVDPQQIVDELLIEVYLFESREITALRIPPILSQLQAANYGYETTNPFAEVERPSPKTAYIRYNPSPEQQKASSVQGISGLFTVKYDVQRSFDAGDMFIVNGYFTHFFAPIGLAPLKKRIVFVLDVSGSMSFSRKLEQVKEAMTQILQDLHEEDSFNIVVFESSTQIWSPTLKRATRENINAATEMVHSLLADGGTNINRALEDGLKMLQHSNEIDSETPIMIFLTDGDPTVGEVSKDTILSNIETKNRQDVQIFSLAFGDDANYEFLKKISARNNAFARKIYADSDAMLQLTNFYEEISTVTLSKVSFTYLDDRVNLTSLTQTQFPSFFEGSELVVSGRLNEDHPDFNMLTMAVVGSGNQGIIEMTSSFDVRNKYKPSSHEFKSNFDFEMITEKMWAYLTINKYLEEMLRTENRILKKEIKLEAIELAIKYNFVTPVTSMVVIKPEKELEENKTVSEFQDDDANALNDNAGNAALTLPNGTAPSSAQQLTGKGTVAPSKAFGDSDPHFIVNVKGLEYAVCFDVMGVEGDEYRLINDTYADLFVTAKVVANKAPSQEHEPNSGEIKTFLGEITIKRSKFLLTIGPTTMRIMRETIDWVNGQTISQGKTKIVVDTAGSMVVIMFNDRIALLVMRHLRSKAQLTAGKVNFLGFYIVDDSGLSYHTHGLLGQFLHRQMILKKTKHRKGKLMGRLRVTGNTIRPRKVMATLGHRLNLATNETVSCWMVQHNGSNLIDGNITDYLMNGPSISDENT